MTSVRFLSIQSCKGDSHRTKTSKVNDNISTAFGQLDHWLSAAVLCPACSYTRLLLDKLEEWGEVENT